MLLASLVIVVVASLGDDPNYYHVENWQAPTMADLTTCATMAEELNASFRYLADNGLNTDWQTKEASCDVHLAKIDTPIVGAIIR